MFLVLVRFLVLECLWILYLYIDTWNFSWVKNEAVMDQWVYDYINYCTIYLLSAKLWDVFVQYLIPNRENILIFFKTEISSLIIPLFPNHVMNAAFWNSGSWWEIENRSLVLQHSRSKESKLSDTGARCIFAIRIVSYVKTLKTLLRYYSLFVSLPFKKAAICSRMDIFVRFF